MKTNSITLTLRSDISQKLYHGHIVIGVINHIFRRKVTNVSMKNLNLIIKKFINVTF